MLEEVADLIRIVSFSRGELDARMRRNGILHGDSLVLVLTNIINLKGLMEDVND